MKIANENQMQSYDYDNSIFIQIGLVFSNQE